MDFHFIFGFVNYLTQMIHLIDGKKKKRQAEREGKKDGTRIFDTTKRNSRAS